MDARAVDEAEARLQELRLEWWLDFGLAAVVFGFSLAATQILPQLALALFLAAVFAWAIGIRSLYRHWDLLDRLADERDAYVIAEVVSYASRHATLESRHSFAIMIRRAPVSGLPPAVAAELEALTDELDDSAFALDPACAVACMRLLTEPSTTPMSTPCPHPE
jgi:hypothetical protein